MLDWILFFRTTETEVRHLFGKRGNRDYWYHGDNSGIDTCTCVAWQYCGMSPHSVTIQEAADGQSAWHGSARAGHRNRAARRATAASSSTKINSWTHARARTHIARHTEQDGDGQRDGRADGAKVKRHSRTRAMATRRFRLPPAQCDFS